MSTRPKKTPKRWHNFEPGDIVQLRSGGPLMTVERTVEDDDGLGVKCCWFYKGEHSDAEFYPWTLRVPVSK